MWPLIFLFLGGGIAYAAFRPSAPPAQGTPLIPSAPAAPAVLPTPSVPAGATFPIPDATVFVATVLADNTACVTWGGATLAAMAQALSAREWRVNVFVSGSMGDPSSIASYGPPTLANAANADALTTMRIAAMAGFNVWLDADAALKLAGTSATDPTDSEQYIAFADDAPIPDAVSSNVLATTPVLALQAATDASFDGSAWVLFARAGSQF